MTGPTGPTGPTLGTGMAGSSQHAGIGLDMGGTKCAGLLLDAAGQMVAEHIVPTPGREGPEAVLAALTGVAQLMFNKAAERELQVVGIGVGVPGLITLDGELRFAGHLGGRVGLRLGELLPARFGVPAVIDNDNTAAAYAEWVSGAAQGFGDVLYVGFGTGIGGGIISGGVLQRGANGFAGEVGHIAIDPLGPECTCGRRGCWELVASGLAMGRHGERAIEAGTWIPPVGVMRPVRGIDVTDHAATGDVGALAVIEAFARHLAAGLVNLSMVLDPAVIVLGGGAMTRHDLLLPPVAARFRALLGGSADLRPIPALRGAQHGPRAGAIGAALLALHAAA